MLLIIQSLLLITLLSTIVFSFIYANFQEKGFLHGLYTSAMIQTLVGVQDDPESSYEKTAMILQSIISYLLTAHIIIFSHEYISKY
jgi:uncharacterized membrane protein